MKLRNNVVTYAKAGEKTEQKQRKNLYLIHSTN